MSTRTMPQEYLSLNERAMEYRAGNVGSLEQIIKTLAARIRSVALKLSPRGGSSVDEMITDGISAIPNATLKWDPSRGVSFSTYCMKCVENAMLNRKRSIGRYQREVGIDSVPEAFLAEEMQGSEFESIGDLVGLTANGDIAVETMKQMSVQQRKLILMIVNGRSMADTAAACGITEEVAKRRLRTALQFIRFDLQRATDFKPKES